MIHPLIDLGMDLDCALRELASDTRSTRVRQRVLDAAQAIRDELLKLTLGLQKQPTTIGDVHLVLEAARRSGVPWPSIADEVRALQGDDGT